MSLLFRSLRRSLKELTGTPLSFWEKVSEKIDDIIYMWYHSRLSDPYYNMKRLLKNLPTFIRLAYKWRSWDSYSSVDVFAELIRRNGMVVRKGYMLNSEKYYRRAMTSYGLFQVALNPPTDKTWRYLFDKNPIKFIKDGDNNYCRMTTTYNTPENIYNGMMKLALKREEAREKRAWQDAWSYVGKYLNNFSD